MHDNLHEGRREENFFLWGTIGPNEKSAYVGNEASADMGRNWHNLKGYLYSSNSFHLHQQDYEELLLNQTVLAEAKRQKSTNKNIVLGLWTRLVLSTHEDAQFTGSWRRSKVSTSK